MKGPKQEYKPQHKPEGIKFPDISREIEAMAATDQEIRSVDARGDTDLDHELAGKMQAIDEKNTERMKQIVGQIGWPTVSKVGKEQSSQAWLIVQHADHDIDFQKECLILMKKESKGEVDLHDIAYLEDRIKVNTNAGQIYGTQFQETRDVETNSKVIGYGPKPIEDVEHVNERRASVGLEPLEKYTEHLTRKYYPHLLEKK